VTWSSTTIAIAAALLAATTACAPRPRMCTASSDCTAQSACVAGRCQPSSPNVKPAVDTARRLVVHPVELAYLRRGDGPSRGALPPLFALGRDSAVLMMRFSVALPKAATIVEAYVVLHRSDAVDDDPAPVSLHATRIIEAWDGGSISWALQPRVVEMRAPETIVEPGGASLVRLDVRDLVRQWPRHDARDQGIAVAAARDTRSGTTFAFRAVGADRGLASDVVTAVQRQSSGVDSTPDVEPYLELYVR
jgi:hypothetical protein